MKIRYTGPIEELSVAPAGKEGFTVTRLKWAEVDDDVARSLLEQNPDDWEAESAKKSSTKKES